MEKAFAREAGELGERVRELRQDREWSQDKAAEEIGLHPYYLGKVERGEANLSLAVLVAISRGYKVSLSDLFEG